MKPRYYTWKGDKGQVKLYAYGFVFKSGVPRELQGASDATIRKLMTKGVKEHRGSKPDAPKPAPKPEEPKGPVPAVKAEARKPVGSSKFLKRK